MTKPTAPMIVAIIENILALLECCWAIAALPICQAGSRCSRVAGRDHVVDDLLGEPKVDHRAEPATDHPAATAPVLSIAEEFSVTPGPPEPDNEHDARGQQREQEALEGQEPKLI